MHQTPETGSVAQTPWATPLIYPQSLWLIGMTVFALVAVWLALRACWLALRGDARALMNEYGPDTVEDELQAELFDIDAVMIDIGAIFAAFLAMLALMFLMPSGGNPHCRRLRRLSRLRHAARTNHGRRGLEHTEQPRDDRIPSFMPMGESLLRGGTAIGCSRRWPRGSAVHPAACCTPTSAPADDFVATSGLLGGDGGNRGHGRTTGMEAMY